MRTQDYYLQRARDILRTIQYATIATVTPDGLPWNSPVAHELGDDLSVYWFSDKENQHSINVRNNQKAFIVIYDSTAPEGTGEGIYVEVTVEELNSIDAINNLCNIKKNKIVDDAHEFLGEAIRRCYKATPIRMWINDAEEENGEFLRDYKVELNIEDVKNTF